jgi:antitoxin YefM
VIEQEEPYESRGSRTVLWERRGETPLRDPTRPHVDKKGTNLYKLSNKYLYLYFNSNLKNTKMKAANFTEFRTKLKQYLDEVENNNETLIIKRGSGNGAVLISLDEFNSILETVHLLSSKNNADRLYESIKQMKSGKKLVKKLIED